MPVRERICLRRIERRFRT